MLHRDSEYRLKVSNITYQLPLPTDLIEAHMRVAYADDGELIDAYLREATEALEQDTRTFLREATVIEYYDWFPLSCMAEIWRLHRAPVTSVTAIRYQDTDGAQQVWDAANYVVDLTGKPARIALAEGGTLPKVKDVLSAVEVEYECKTASLPSQAVHAILKRATSSYEKRMMTDGEQRVWQLALRQLIYSW